MAYEEQEIVTIGKDDLLGKVQALMDDGCRLVQIGCTKLADHFQIDYSFDKYYEFHNLRVELPLTNPELPSISAICLPAFLYENEIHDLFGINITGISIDFKGKFYRLEKDAPFSSVDEQGDVK
ncbi:MAG: NADH-quinone oxidoreductase subunit C [Gammaproteobacteria bacterium]|jgi:ech hydrogenase subunit D